MGGTYRGRGERSVHCTTSAAAAAELDQLCFVFVFFLQCHNPAMPNRYSCYWLLSVCVWAVQSSPLQVSEYQASVTVLEQAADDSKQFCHAQTHADIVRGCSEVCYVLCDVVCDICISWCVLLGVSHVVMSCGVS